MGWDYVLPIFKEVKLNLEDKKVRILNKKNK